VDSREQQVTIVIPLLCQPDDWLDTCVRSALDQTVPCEVIVVRSARTPPSNLDLLARLQADCPRLIVTLEEKPSFPGALNRGIRLAKAARVGFLLSDDWLDPTAVEDCLQLDADIVCTGLTRYEADGETALPQISKVLTEEAFHCIPSLQAQACYLEHFFLFRKAKLLEVGGLDESIGDYPGIDDYHLIWTLLEAGATVRIVEKSLYNKRDHAGERLTLHSKKERTANLKKILDKHGVTGRRKRRLIHYHSRWFGRPVHVVYEEIQRQKFKRLRALLGRLLYGHE
jgi:glycosyltransferase involved in cell wall biosynthesis